MLHSQSKLYLDFSCLITISVKIRIRIPVVWKKGHCTLTCVLLSWFFGNFAKYNNPYNSLFSHYKKNHAIKLFTNCIKQNWKRMNGVIFISFYSISHTSEKNCINKSHLRIFVLYYQLVTKFNLYTLYTTLVYMATWHKYVREWNEIRNQQI